MHPAVSVIFFTVLSGTGFGLIFFLGLGYPILPGALAAFIACALAIGLTGAGLVASTFHLGHPERAWRAMSQWRSSWLSREGAMSLITLGLFGSYAVAWIFFDRRIAPLGWTAAVCAFVSVITTAMIYAQLKTVPHWRTPLTPVSYLLFSLAAGLIMASAAGSTGTIFGAPASLMSIALLSFAWGMKTIWWRRAKRATLASLGSTPESATGLGRIGKVRLLERPHTGPNYLTKEMVFRIARKHAEKVRLIAFAFGAIIPILICFAVYAVSLPMLWQGLAAASLILGLFAERWLFFAEAEHSVSLYY